MSKQERTCYFCCLHGPDNSFTPENSRKELERFKIQSIDAYEKQIKARDQQLSELEAKLNDTLGNVSTIYALHAIRAERDEALERLRIAQERIKQLEEARGLA